MVYQYTKPPKNNTHLQNHIISDMYFATWPGTLSETNSSHLKIGRARESLPTIHFQVLLLLVSGRVSFFFGQPKQKHHVIHIINQGQPPGPSDPSTGGNESKRNESDGETVTDRGTEASWINTLPPCCFLFFFSEKFLLVDENMLGDVWGMLGDDVVVVVVDDVVDVVGKVG